MAKKKKHELDDIIKDDNLMFLGGLTGATAISGGGEVAGQLSGMINPNTKGGGAASGAMKGVSMGSALGPYGMAAGAVIGGVAGFVNAQNQQNRAEFSDNINSLKERDSMLGLKAAGGSLRTYSPANPKPLDDWYNFQPFYTEGLKNKYKNIPIDNIVKNASNDSTFKNSKLNQYNDSLISKYGEAYLTENEVDSIASRNNIPNIFDIDKQIKESDLNGVGSSNNTKGSKENSLNKYGYRMMLHRSFPQGSSPYKASGGYILPLGTNPNQSSLYEGGGELTEFNNGGSHSENIYDGIPQGVAEDGQQNKVEQGETKWQDYIFSDRLLLDKSTVEQHNLPKSMTGKTFAEASKKLSKLVKERPNDPISKNTHSDYMKHLVMANDLTRNNEESAMMNDGGYLYKNGSRLLKKALKPETEGSLGIEDWMMDESLFGGNKNNNISALDGVQSKNGFNIPSALKDPKNLRYAPIAFDALAATGLLGKSPEPEQYSPTLIQQQGNLTPMQVDEMQMRNAVDSAYQTGASGLSEASGGSGAALRAGLSGLNSDYMSGIGSAYSVANKANMASKMAADEFNLGMSANTAAQNAQSMNQAGMFNTQAINQNKNKRYEDSMSYLAKGAEGLGDIGYEERMREIMPRIYGYDDYGRYVAPLNKKCGGRLRLKNHKK